MPDATSLISLAISAGAFVLAYGSYRRAGRAFEIAEDDHLQRKRDREARPELGVEVHPHNRVPDDDGVIRVRATSAYVNLAIGITNSGSRPAGHTRVEVWSPKVVGSLKWVGSSGAEQDVHGDSAPDLSTKLPIGDGREFDTRRMTRTLETVPLIGEPSTCAWSAPWQIAVWA